MLRLLLIGLALFLAYQLLRAKFFAPNRPPRSKDGGKLMQCHACHTWIGEEAAVHRADKTFCSPQCAERDENGPS